MNTIEAINYIRDYTNARIYIVASGAGAGLQQLLWSIPGCSKFLVGAEFPYATEAIDRFLGFKPEKYCSEATAIDMSMEAFMRAGADKNSIGLGITASVATNTQHRGEHRIHIATMSFFGCILSTVYLVKKSEIGRIDDGQTADLYGLYSVLNAIGYKLPDNLSITFNNSTAFAMERFLLRPHFNSNDKREPIPEKLSVVFPGAFNPPHEGHFSIVESYTKTHLHIPTFWITINSPHKGSLSLGEILQRVNWLRGYDVLFTLDDQLYIDKAKRFPGCSFILGSDALVRLLEPQWTPVEPMLKLFRSLETKFYVYSRGKYNSVKEIPSAPLDICYDLPGKLDISSTEIRKKTIYE